MKTQYNYIEGKTPIYAWTKGVPLEAKAEQQLKTLSTLPFIHKHIAVMPDVHWGMGSTIGSVIPTKGAIIPAAVGVDIGCGMCAVRTSLNAEDLPDDLWNLRTKIELAVPHGRTNDGKSGDRGAWGNPPEAVQQEFQELLRGLNFILEEHPKVVRRGTVEQRSLHQLGTLGTGNHFIEVCLDEEDRVWTMLHSGSRGIGNAIGMYFINLAKEDMRKWFVNLPDGDLSYLVEGTKHFDYYILAVEWAQAFARINRTLMMNKVLSVLRYATTKRLWITDEAINCHHNYVTRENHFNANIWVTRKGAVRAREGDLGIIPGSMGAKSFIVRGKGNKDSFNSCAHGAGRVMGRGEAKRTFTVEDHIRATVGVECRKDESVIDETPGAYKDIDAVMAAQSDLVDIVHTLKQVVCVKG